MNDLLVKHYLPMEKETMLMPEPNVNEIFDALYKYTNGDYVWEIVNEEIIPDNETIVMTTVQLYMPGRILTGRSLCDLKDYSTNHLYALLDAFSVVTAKSEKTKKEDDPMPKPRTKNGSNQMTAEEIAEMTGNKETTKKEKSDPFLVTKEEAADNKPFNAEEPVKKKKRKFTEEQIKALRQIRIDFDITTDEEFGKLVHTWSNGKLSSKKDITPKNADDFINYVRNELGEA